MVLEQKVVIGNKAYTVVISDEASVLAKAKACSRAVIGVERPGHSLEGAGGKSCASYVIPGFEYATKELAELVLRRFLGLPWLIDRTERLEIRELDAKDAACIPAEENPAQEEIFRSETLLKCYIKNQYSFYEYGTWAVVLRENNALVGLAGVSNPRLPEDLEQHLDQMNGGIASDSRAGPMDPSCFSSRHKPWLELGYHIFRPFRGRGYGLEAAAAVRNYAHEVLEARLCAIIDVNNKASRGLAERLNMVSVKETDTESSKGLLLYVERCL